MERNIREDLRNEFEKQIHNINADFIVLVYKQIEDLHSSNNQKSRIGN